MPIKIAFIGAGSVGFTRRLVQDVLLVPELRETHFALHDINRHNLDMIAQLLRKDVAANGLPATITTHLERRPALDGANYVINCTRIGGLEAFETDIEIPLKYGVDQCVGDTICAGGLMYAQRNIPQVLAFVRDCREVAADDCLFLNYANPMAMNCWAALDAHDRGEGVQTIGLCHGVQHGHQQIARVLGVDPKDNSDWMQRVPVICAGINHQTWYTKVMLDGREISGEELLGAFERHETYSRQERVRIDVLRRFGLFSTESNGHLSEYLPWYRKRPERIADWISTDAWIHGETGGYLRNCREGRGWFETDFPRWLDEAGRPMEDWSRSHEHGSYIIESLETGRPYRGHFNVRNAGVIANLPPDCVVEAPGYVDGTGLHMMAGIVLPQACAATCRASVDVQRMGKDAAMAGDVTLLKQAMLHDPLVGAVCEPEEVWQMTDEMLVAGRAWLPQYEATGEGEGAVEGVEEGAVDAAAARLERHERDETRVALRQTRGAVRLRERSMAEVRVKRAAQPLTPGRRGSDARGGGDGVARIASRASSEWMRDSLMPGWGGCNVAASPTPATPTPPPAPPTPPPRTPAAATPTPTSPPPPATPRHTPSATAWPPARTGSRPVATR